MKKGLFEQIKKAKIEEYENMPELEQFQIEISHPTKTPICILRPGYTLTPEQHKELQETIDELMKKWEMEVIRRTNYNTNFK